MKELFSQKNILEKVDHSISQVYSGKYPYERDSVLFNKIEYSWPLTSGLLLSANINKPLNVIDFGGSLGSTYLQNKKFLKSFPLKWNIVEQESFVELGNTKYKSETLQFFNSVEECIKVEKVNTLLISSTLQYISDPVSCLQNLLEYDFSFIILDRLSIISSPEKRLTVQTVPFEIYKAKYPCWFFNEEEILSLFSPKYELIEEFDSSIRNEVHFEDGVYSVDKGYIFKLRNK